MKRLYLFASIIFLAAFAIASFNLVHAFFSDLATSTSNTFTAAASFPTATPPTATPTPSQITMYLSPASGNVGIGETFPVQLRINSHSQPINVVHADITFPESLLSVVNLDQTGSAFGLSVINSSTASTITIDRGVTPPNPSITGDNLIVTIYFVAKPSVGNALVDILDSSQAAENGLPVLQQRLDGTYSIGTNHIVISEVQIGAGVADDEFIELYNPTSVGIGLLALSLKLHIISSTGTDNNKTITFINNTIPAHGYFLIGSATSYTGSTPLDATYSTTSGNALVANGAVYISDSTSSDKTGLIDLLGFGTSIASNREDTAFTPNPTAGQSAERKALSSSTNLTMGIGGADEFKGNGFDTDSNSTDFVPRTVSQPQNSGSAAENP